MTTVQQMDLIEAIRQRDRGMDYALDPKSAYRDSVEAAIAELARSGFEFSSDDVRKMCGDPPRGVHPNVAGALFHAAARAGLIRHQSYMISARVRGHGNLVRVWTGIK